VNVNDERAETGGYEWDCRRLSRRLRRIAVAEADQRYGDHNYDDHDRRG
jgi:hypothetical protein